MPAAFVVDVVVPVVAPRVAVGVDALVLAPISPPQVASS